MRREREGEQEPKCCGEVEPEHRTGQCRKHCLGYCRGHRRALHGVLQGASHKVRQGASQGAFPRSSLLYQWGEARGCLPQSPPDQGFPICPTAPGWGFSANLPVGCRAAPGSGDVPRSGENGVQGLELTPHVACLNPRLPPRPPKHCQGNGCKIGKAKSGQHPASAPTLLTPAPSCLRCPHGDRDGDRATLGLRGGSLAARGWETQSSPPASRGEDPASPQSSLSPSFLLGNLMCNLPAKEAQDCNFQPWGTCLRICFLSLGRQMKRQTRARRAPEFTAPPTLLQDPHPACSRAAFLPSLGC